MTDTTEMRALLAQAIDAAANVLDGIGHEQATLPTPCEVWDVRTVTAHLVNDMDQFAIAVRGGQPDWSAAIPPLAGSWGDALRTGGGELLDAWQIADNPPSRLISQQLAEIWVHTWDLAAATDASLVIDPQAAEIALAWAQTAMLPEFRGESGSGKSFGPEVLVPADAPVGDRLVGFFGRDPAWRRP